MVSTLNLFVICVTLFSISIQAALECEELAVEDCAFAVSGLGSRCVLEKRVLESKIVVYQCQTSPVLAERSEAWIETDECLAACGLERMSVGISTDGIIRKEFLSRWCSSQCQANCPNVVDLFTKLASGEDIHLPHICNSIRPSSRKLIGESLSAMSKGTKQAIDSLHNAEAPEALHGAEAPESLTFLDSSDAMAPSPDVM
ncbi:uncharacterized protein LOC9652438 [Selaginella moellendorffii]|nr:uncharacterized protein LOC9652438 [Selaginella moellendorffii]|eukprot:XP_002993113.2 uncharacterized protein LOC9652438 [Selaginella moellendorffii]